MLIHSRARTAPPWDIVGRMGDSGISHVVFCSFWLLIFSHKRNEVPERAQTPKGHPKLSAEEKAKFHGSRMTTGKLIPPVTMMHLDWMTGESQVNEPYVCSWSFLVTTGKTMPFFYCLWESLFICFRAGKERRGGIASRFESNHYCISMQRMCSNGQCRSAQDCLAILHIKVWSNTFF